MPSKLKNPPRRADRPFVKRPQEGEGRREETARQENEIAARVQSSILPGEVEIEGLGISAGMLPAEVVGGDYYDIIAVKGGCWIAIGDVAGHGLAAGVIMLMIQSAVQSLVRLSPRGSPRDLLCALNGALYENIRERMKRDEHVTFCLARYSADGELVFAGAHENILVCRSSGGDCESIPAEGAWLGAMKDVRRATSETSIQLGPGDLMVLFTDGVIETRNGKGEEFGFDRLRTLLMDGREQSPQQIRSSIMDSLLAWNARPDDDVTLVVVRCRGVYWGE
jgi:sigma-B regulation protein RsbU (phosphoserine phosphatase)